MPNEEYFEGSEIELDSGNLVGAAGWTLGAVSVERVGSLVAIHIEATNAVSAAALIATLPGDYTPSATLTDQTGNFTLAANGALSFNASKAAAALRVAEFVFRAALQSP